MGGALDSRLRWSSIFETISGSSITATTPNLSDPQLGQRLISILNERFINLAQLYLAAGDSDIWSLSSESGSPVFGFSMLSGRSLEFGASTPEYLNKLNLGSGTSAANFSISSMGDSLIWVMPLLQKFYWPFLNLIKNKLYFYCTRLALLANKMSLFLWTFEITHFFVYPFV